MNRKDLLYRDFTNKMTVGYAYHKIITNKKGKPVDYEFIEVNPAFEKLTGLKIKDVIGKKVTEVMPDIKKAKFDWIGFYGKVALKGKKETFEQFSEPLKRWYSVDVSCPEKGYFVTLFNDITERKRAEQALKESEKRYRIIFELANDAFAIIDSSGKIISANKKAFELSGLSEKELGRNITELGILPPTSLAIIQKNLKLRLAGKEVSPYEVEMRPRVGKPKIIEISASALQDAKGTIIGDLAIIRDITERKLAFTALKESEEKYRNLVERANDGIVIIQDEIIRFANRRLAEMWGGTAKEIINTPFAAYIHPTELPKLNGRYKKRMRGEKVTSVYETVLKRKDGRKLFAELNASVIMFHGKPADLVLVRDITERKKADTALKESEEKYRSLVKNVNIGIYRSQADPSGKFIEVNPAMCQIFGYKSLEELEQVSVVDLYQNSKDRKTFIEKIVKNGLVKNEERRLKKKDGTPIIVSISARTHRDSTGKIDWFDGVIEDITERKQMEAVLRESEEKYRSLVKNVNIGIFRAEPTGAGRFIEVNPALVRMLGYPSEKELMRFSPTDLYLSPNDRADYLNKLKKHGFVTAEELKFKKKSGAIFTVSVTARVHRDKSGRIDWIDGVIEDITDRKKDEEALHRREVILEAVAFAAERFLQKADWKSSIQEILARLGKAAQVSRVYIFEKHTAPDGRLLTSQRYEWVAKGITAQIDNPLMQNLDVKATGFGRWVKILSKNQTLYGNIRDFPISERKFLSAQDVLSIALVPIFSQETLWGFIGFDDCLTEREWTQIELDTLKAAASIIGSVIQQQLTAKMLSESEEEYHSLVENVNIGIYRNTADPSGKFVEVNPAMCRMFGYDSSEELKQFSVANLYQNSDDRKAFIEKIVKNGLVKNEELRLKKKDGTPIIASVTARAHRDSKGKIDWFDGAIEDITERKQEELALVESEEKYRALVNMSPLGIIAHVDGKIIFSNPAAARLLKAKYPEQLIGRPALEFVHPDFHEFAKARISKVLIEDWAAPPAEAKFICYDGKVMDVETTARRFVYQSKTALLLVFTDITARKQSEAALKQAKETAEHANKVKTAFLANMSHELRTPMHSILGFTDLLMEREENGNKERKELLGIVKNSSDKLLHIINELLDLSRIETGKMIVEKKEFSIIDTAKKLQKIYQPLTQEKGLIFNLKLNKNLPELICGDEIKIEQIITNLLNNALKYTHKGKIELYLGMLEGRKLAKNEGILEYYVKDTGIGIEPQKMSSLFEQYLQTNGYLTRISGGARLGLAIVKQLTDLMKGQIKVKSTIGKGTKFIIQQPVEIAGRKL